MSEELQIRKRIFGLDIVRALAISLVLFSNLLYIIDNRNPLFISLSGLINFAGIEFFFVLTGFLIGTIILKSYISNSFDFKSVLMFLKRRMMRILPSYYLVLILNVIVGFSLDYVMNDTWRYFFFLQNFAEYQITFFYESWSLSIGIWAFLLVPFVFLLTYKLSKNKKISFLLTTLGLILFFNLVRFWFYKTHFISDMNQWNEQIKSVAIYRIDTILIGFVVAWFHFFYTTKLKNISVYLFILALHLFFLQFVAMNVLGYEIIATPKYFLVYYFTFSSITFALTLPFFANLTHAKGIIANCIVWISKLSYSIYLVYFSLVFVLFKSLKENYFEGVPTLFLILFYLFMVTFFSYMLHRFVEKPIMDKR